MVTIALHQQSPPPEGQGLRQRETRSGRTAECTHDHIQHPRAAARGPIPRPALPDPTPGHTVPTVSEPGRPSVDVRTALEAAEWRELVGESRRLTGFRLRTALGAALVVAAATACAVLGMPVATAATGAAVLLAALGSFALAYAVVGPRLSWPRIGTERLTVHWRVHADGIEAERAGHRLILVWTDVDRVVVTRRLIVLHLVERGEVLGLPRRAATDLGEELVTAWAEDSGAEVVRRRRDARPGRSPRA